MGNLELRKWIDMESCGSRLHLADFFYKKECVSMKNLMPSIVAGVSLFYKSCFCY
jgi:hypothetical protein